VNTETSSAKKPTVLLVTDQLPFPPRNGVTLPVYNYAIGLRANRVLKLLLIIDAAAPVSTEALAQNEAIFGKIAVVLVRRKSRIARVLGEILGNGMYKDGWQRMKEGEIPSTHLADALIVSPFSAVAKWDASTLGVDTNFRIKLAAVNDCTTAEYYFRGTQSFGSMWLVVKGVLDFLRSYRIATIEARTLSHYHQILMQTETDLGLMRRLVSQKLADRVVLVPNGIRPALLALTPRTDSKTVLFVAELSGEYAPIVQWLICEVWPRVMMTNEDWRLLIIGRGATPLVKEAICSAEGVSHIEFVEDLGAVYDQAAIAISPVFKGYGLINKTLEAMASGVPVVGGVAAFNGIEGFRSGRHGFSCRARDAAGFAAAICNLIGDSKLRTVISAEARRLVESQFQWVTAVSKIENILDISGLRSIAQ